MIIIKLLQQLIVDLSPLLIQMVKLKVLRVLLLEIKPLMFAMMAIFLKEQKKSIVKMMVNILMMLLNVNVSLDNKPTIISTLNIGIDCGDLSDIPNGNVVIAPDTSLGSTATYSCDAGFNLVGEDTRTCQTNGEWSGEEPSCARKLFIP